MPERQKIVYRQLEYAEEYRAILIEGYKNVDCNLKNFNDTHSVLVAQWLLNRPTSSGNRMFTRLYARVDNVTELLVKQEYHKEAMDWARFAISETVRSAENANLKEIFNDAKDALDKVGKMPAWEPHRLSEIVAKYKIPKKCRTSDVLKASR
jgi:hypothetical protein